MAALCDWNMRMYDLGATAAIERSKEAAIHALLLDPLCAASRLSRFERQVLVDWLSPLGCAWESVLSLDARLGGLGGTELYIGVEGDFGVPIGGPATPRIIEGRPHQFVGWNASMCWYIDEDGHIVEVDDLGKLVVAQIQSVAGITRTLTCPIVHI